MAWSAEKSVWARVGWAPGGMPGDSVCSWTL